MNNNNLLSNEGIAATKILQSLNLVVGRDVNEFAIPVIAQIIKNDVCEKDHERIELLEKALANITADAEKFWAYAGMPSEDKSGYSFKQAYDALTRGKKQ